MKTRCLIIIFLVVSTAFLAKGAILPVCKSCPFTRVKDAVAKAKEKDTVLIKEGLYKENSIEINKPIVLLGTNFPIIDGEKNKSVLVIKSSNVTIKGITFSNSGKGSLDDYAGVKIIGGKNIIIENNRIKYNFFGIYLSGVSHSQVTNNEVIGNPTTEQNSGNGIHLWQCDNVVIKNNKVSGHRDGIYFEFVTNTNIYKNLSFKNIRYGLHFMFSHDNIYENNTFRQNGAGVAVMYTHGVKMINNKFEENWGGAAYGLLLKDITDSQIRNNRFCKNTIALHMEGSNRIKIENNLFSNNGWAVRIQASCMDNNFKLNDFKSNTFDVATNGSLVMNTFNENYWDKYEGYDLNKDKIGDVPYRPVSVYSMIVEQMPYSLMLYRSFMTTLMDRVEKVVPSLIPEDLIDKRPRMK